MFVEVGENNIDPINLALTQMNAVLHTEPAERRSSQVLLSSELSELYINPAVTVKKVAFVSLAHSLRLRLADLCSGCLT